MNKELQQELNRIANGKVYQGNMPTIDELLGYTAIHHGQALKNGYVECAQLLAQFYEQDRRITFMDPSQILYCLTNWLYDDYEIEALYGEVVIDVLNIIAKIIWTNRVEL
jgi:hypothetical protein